MTIRLPQRPTHVTGQAELFTAGREGGFGVEFGTRVSLLPRMEVWGITTRTLFLKLNVNILSVLFLCILCRLKTTDDLFSSCIVA